MKISLIYQQLLSDMGASSEVIDLAALPEDFISTALYENSGKNEQFNPLRERMKASEKYVFVIPEYNGSFPGVLKTFIDGLEFPGTFRGKKAALLGLSSGVQGGGLAVSHLTDILNYCGTSVLALKPKLARIDGAMNDDEVTDPLYQALLKEQAEALLDF